MSTLLQEFFIAALIDTFHAKYSYTSTVQTLNIPLEVNFHFLNKSRFNLYVGLGANSSFVLAQQTHLTIIKENSTNDVSYSNVGVNKFNAMLMMSLGCDIRLAKHWYITLLPSYKYGITNMSAVSGTNYKPVFLSVNAGVKFKF